MHLHIHLNSDKTQFWFSLSPDTDMNIMNSEFVCVWIVVENFMPKLIYFAAV